MAMSNKPVADAGPAETTPSESLDANQEDTISNADPPPYNAIENDAESGDENHVSVLTIDPAAATEVPAQSPNKNTGDTL